MRRPRPFAPALLIALLPALALADEEPIKLPENVVLDETVQSELLSPEQVEQTLAESVPELWFCDAKKVEKRHFDRQWCALASDAAKRCPGLAAACTKPIPPAPAQARSGEGGKSILGALAEPLFWILIAGVTGFVLYHLLRALSGLRRERADAELLPAEPALVTVERPTATAPKLSDAERWLELAQQAAAEGHYAVAIRAAYAALAHSLRAHGLVALEVGQTNGELLRSLSEHPELAREFRAVAREMEIIEFGGREATRDSFDRAYRRAHGVVQKLAATLGLLALCSLALGCDEDAALADSPEYGPSGYHLLKSLLSDSGSKVRKRFLPLEQLGHDVDQVIVTGQLEPEAWHSLLLWTAGGGELVTLSHDNPVLNEATRLTIEEGSCGASLKWQYEGGDGEKLTLLGLGKQELRIGQLDYDDESRNVVLNCGDKPYWMTVSHGSGLINVIAERSYLQNASLAAGQNALFVSRMLGGRDMTVELVGPWTGSAASSPLSSMRRSGLMPAVLQLLLLGALFIWRYGTAFGRRRDPLETRQRSFVEHVRVLGACYERAQATRLVLAHYGGWLMERLSRRALAGRRGGVVVTAGAVAARTGISEGEAAELVTEVKLAQGGPPDGSSPDDLLKVRRLEELERKVTS